MFTRNMNKFSKTALLVVIFCFFAFALLPVNLSHANGLPEPEAPAATATDDSSTTKTKTINTSAGLKDVVVGVLFFVMVVYAGFLWMTAAGNEERITKAKNIFSGALIGLIIVMTAYVLVDYVFEILQRSITSS